MIGMLDHEMHVQGESCFSAHEADNVRAEGNIIDEMAVHDVAMDPIGAGIFNFANFLSQM